MENQVKPPWVRQAVRGMMRAAERGHGAEELLCKALMMGANIKPYNHYQSFITHIVYRPVNFPMDGATAHYGTSAEMCAYRWLLYYYPDLLRKMCS